MPDARTGRRSGRECGFTLVELNVAIVILAIVLAAISGVFLTTQRLWERTSSQGAAHAAGAEAISRIARDLSQGCHIYVFTRFTTNDTLVITFPDTTTGDRYSPRWDVGVLRYLAGGTRRVYYLSDGTGSISASGDILWQARLDSMGDTESTVSNNAVPDASLSLWAGTSLGQVRPVKGVRVDPPGAGDPAWLYTVAVTVSDSRNGKSVDSTLTRRVFVRYHE